MSLEVFKTEEQTILFTERFRLKYIGKIHTCTWEDILNEKSFEEVLTKNSIKFI